MSSSSSRTLISDVRARRDHGVLTAPEQPLVVRRADLTSGETVNRLRAEIKRTFAGHGAVYEG